VLGGPLTTDNCLTRANVKAYPCVATGQSAVAASLALRQKLGGDVGKIAALELVLADYPIVRRQAAEPERLDPQTKESADHSFTFCTAVTLLDGAMGTAQFEHERWHDPAVRALMAKITLGFDAGWLARAPNSYPASLVARLADGSEQRVDMPYPPGASSGGLDRQTVIDKFHDVACAALDRAQRERVIEATLDLDRAPSPAALLAAARD
jgi:2-methylcitrate dehydratase